MKKLLSLFLALTMLVTSALGFGISADASVYYDTDKLSDTANYKTLTIYGTNQYKYAFDFLNRVNSYRTNNGASKLQMDADMIEAAMLRAHELVAFYDIDRPSGDYWYNILDRDSNALENEYACVSIIANGSAAVDYLYDSYSSEFISNDIKSAGVGCFLSEEKGQYFWVFFTSKNVAKGVVTVSDFSASVSKAEKVALSKDYLEIWKSNHSHTYVSTGTTPANATKKTNGKLSQKCKTCGATSNVTIYYPSTITLSAANYTYDGKVKTPTVTVKTTKGTVLKKGSDYTVTYASGRKNVGKYAVKITFKGNFTGTVTKYFNINPKNTSISSVTAGSKKFTVKLKKYTTQTTGYQIQYATNSKFTGAKTVSMKNTTVSKAVSKLKGKQKYYVRVRTYKTVKVNGKNTNFYSAWSKAKTITTKK